MLLAVPNVFQNYAQKFTRFRKLYSFYQNYAEIMLLLFTFNLVTTSQNHARSAMFEK